MDYLISISWTGWGTLLKTFLPACKALAIVDFLLYLLLPSILLLVLIRGHRENSANGSFGAWRNCGRTWLKIGGWFLLFHIFLYFFVSEWILTTSLFSIKEQYVVKVLGGDGKRDDKKRITERLRRKNQRVIDYTDSQKASEGGRTLEEGSLLDTESERMQKLSEEDVRELENSSPRLLTRSPRVSTKSKEYKVVTFFYDCFPWLHHMGYALAWLIFIICFFGPGFTMQSERTIISH